MAGPFDRYFTFTAIVRTLEAYTKKFQETYGLDAFRRGVTRASRSRAGGLAGAACRDCLGDRQWSRVVRLSDLRILREDDRARVFSGRQRVSVDGADAGDFRDRLRRQTAGRDRAGRLRRPRGAAPHLVAADPADGGEHAADGPDAGLQQHWHCRAVAGAAFTRVAGRVGGW